MKKASGSKTHGSEKVVPFKQRDDRATFGIVRIAADPIGQRDPGLIKQSEASFAEWRNAKRDASKLIHLGRIEDAQKSLAKYLSTHQNDPTIADLQADIAFRKGEPDRAYAALAPFVAGTFSPQLLLRMSLASSEFGETSTGQGDYCKRIILQDTRFADDVRTTISSGSSVRDVEILSLVALAEFGNSDDDNNRLYFATGACD